MTIRALLLSLCLQVLSPATAQAEPEFWAFLGYRYSNTIKAPPDLPAWIGELRRQNKAEDLGSLLKIYMTELDNYLDCVELRASIGKRACKEMRGRDQINLEAEARRTYLEAASRLQAHYPELNLRELDNTRNSVVALEKLISDLTGLL